LFSGRLARFVVAATVLCVCACASTVACRSRGERSEVVTAASTDVPHGGASNEGGVEPAVVSTLATLDGQVKSAARIGDDLFFVDATGAIARIAPDGVVTRMKGVDHVSNIVGDETKTIYAATDRDIVALPADGGVPATIARGQRSPQLRAADGAFVYWVANDPAGPNWDVTFETAFRRAPVDGSRVETLSGGVLAKTAPTSATWIFPATVAIDGADLLLTRGGPDGNVWRMPASGGAPASLALYGDPLYPLAVTRFGRAIEVVTTGADLTRVDPTVGENHFGHLSRGFVVLADAPGECGVAAFDASGNAYCGVDSPSPRLIRLSPTGEIRTMWTEDERRTMEAIVVGPNWLAVFEAETSDAGAHTIVRRASSR
jgi:hypothetical protein